MFLRYAIKDNVRRLLKNYEGQYIIIPNNLFNNLKTFRNKFEIRWFNKIYIMFYRLIQTNILCLVIIQLSTKK